jgi:hypothetical protein
MVLTFVVFPLGSVFATMPFPSALVTAFVLPMTIFFIASLATVAVMTIATCGRGGIKTCGHS